MEKVPALEVYQLTKYFGPPDGGTTAVSSVSLTLSPGDIYALIGQNGAGKTTLVKLIVGLLSPTSGTAVINGHDIATDPVHAKTQFAYIPDEPFTYDFLSGIEFLRLTGNLRGLTQTQIEARIKELATLFPLDQQLTEPIESYSRGNKQKVAILASLLGRPKLLVIDEPVVGLDPTSSEIFGNTLVQFAKHQGTVFLVTHTLPFAAKYANRVGILNHGKVVYEKEISPKTSLESLYQKYTVV